MEVKFTAYSLSKKRMAEFSVTSKIRTDVHGHMTYMLAGHEDDGIRMTALVSKSQWDRYDVPVEERSIRNKINRKMKRVKMLQPAKKRKTPFPKARRKVYNEEIEQWLASHNGICLDSI